MPNNRGYIDRAIEIWMQSLVSVFCLGFSQVFLRLFIFL